MFPRRLLAFALLWAVLAASLGGAQAQPADSAASAKSLTLARLYDVTGTNPNGSRYTGTLAVEIISNTTFSVRWNIGGSVYRGFGMRMNDALSMTYTLGGNPGLVIYRAKGDGEFEGLWAVRGQEGNGTERLTPRE